METPTKTEEEKISLFAHPLTFVVTHLALPILATLACAYCYWLTCDALDGVLASKALAALIASAALPFSAVGVLLCRPKRLNAWLMFAYAFIGVAFLYFSVPVLGDMSQKVDDWIIGPTPMVAMFSGIVPLVFAGVARIATAKWRMSSHADVGMTIACLIAPPFAVYLVVNILFRFPRFFGDMKLSPLLESIMAHVMAVGYFLGSAIFFIGLLRILHKLFTVLGRCLPENFKRFFGAVLFGLVLPLGGLALNMNIPFPADFANPWAWGLAVFTGLVLCLPTKGNALGLAAYFLKFVAAPFVLYFFILFVPFLPLAIPAIIVMGAGFLILAPTLLFRYWTRDVHASYLALRPRFGRARLVAVAMAGALILPAAFVADVEMERRDVKALLAWHTEEDYDQPPAPMPVSQKRAEKIMKGVNDYTFGAEIPFLTAWRTWRVYGGMYMADKLRNELNLRILGKKVDDERDWEGRSRNFFAGSIFGANTARREPDRGARNRWGRPARTELFSAEAKPTGEDREAVFTVTVKPLAKSENCEFVADLSLPAGAWVEGMRLKMTNGTWKVARPSERKSAEWVYNKITERFLDPSIVTLDTPTAGILKVCPVGKDGREVELTVRLPSLDASPFIATLNGQAVAKPLYPMMDDSRFYTAEGAAVSVVPEEWMLAHTNELVSVSHGEAERYFADDPELTRRLRRRLRQAAAMLAEKGTGEMPVFEFFASVTNETPVGYSNCISLSERRILWRELPGVVSLGDRPLDGWLFLDGEDGGKVAVPYRKGDGGAVVFASLKGAAKIGGAWAEGAKAWELENLAFRKPALDVRRELLEMTRKTGTLTTKSAYIAVETAAQEKGLLQKEMEALHGDKSLDFDESTAQSGDAPGFFVLLAIFALFVALPVKYLTRRGGDAEL